MAQDHCPIWVVANVTMAMGKTAMVIAATGTVTTAMDTTEHASAHQCSLLKSAPTTTTITLTSTMILSIIFMNLGIR